MIRIKAYDFFFLITFGMQNWPKNFINALINKLHFLSNRINTF
jgi:hypothetical protein